MEEKIQKFSKVIYILAKFGRICFTVSFGFALAALIWLFIIGEGDGSIQLSEHVTVYAPISGLSMASGQEELSVPLLGSYIGYILLCCFFIVNILKLVQKLFGTMMKSRTPFEYENAKMIQKISIWIIIYSIVPNLATVAFGTSLASIYGMDSDFNNITNGTSIFIAIIFFCLSEIFKYGCELQKQADETL